MKRKLKSEIWFIFCWKFKIRNEFIYFSRAFWFLVNWFFRAFIQMVLGGENYWDHNKIHFIH